MKKCPNCNKEYDDSIAFCTEDGTKLEEVVVEEEPVAAPAEEPVAAPAEEPVAAQAEEPVAAPAEEPVAAPAEEPVAAPAEEPAATPVVEKKKFETKKLLLLIPVALVIVLAIIFIPKLFGKSNDFIVYLKDKELFYSSKLNGKDAFQISTDYIDGDADNADAQDYALDTLIIVSDDGKYIFYMDEIDDGDSNLYYRYANNAKKEPVKISNEVSGYAVSEDCSQVIYKKDGSLYLYSMKKDDSEKITSDFTSVAFNNDFSIIYFSVYDDGDYKIYSYIDGEKEKIDSSDGTVLIASNDFKTVFYLKDDILYKKALGSDKEKIASDVYNAYCQTDDNEFYYLIKNDDEKDSNLSNYIEDDMKEADKTEIEYPFSLDFDTEEAYEAAKEAYYNQEIRNYIREYAEDYSISTTTYSLYYYNGKDSTLVSDKLVTVVDSAVDGAVIAYKQSADIDGKVKISDYTYEKYGAYGGYSAISDIKDDLVSSDSTVYLVIDGTVTTLTDKDAYNVNISSDGSVVYYTDEANDDYEANLFKATISGTKVKSTEKVDRDVYTSYFTIAENNSVIYYKDFEYDHYTGTAYVDGVKVDDDVYSIYYNEDVGKYFVKTDYDSDKSTYSLSTFDGKKTAKISDDIYLYRVLPSGKIVFISDYSSSKHRGTLYLYKEKENVRLDDDVSYVLYSYSVSDYLEFLNG